MCTLTYQKKIITKDHLTILSKISGENSLGTDIKSIGWYTYSRIGIGKVILK